jgi:hypothetical protein
MATNGHANGNGNGKRKFLELDDETLNSGAEG